MVRGKTRIFRLFSQIFGLRILMPKILYNE